MATWTDIAVGKAGRKRNRALKEISDAVMQTVRVIENLEEQRYDNYKRNAEVYANKKIDSFKRGEWIEPHPDNSLFTLNVAKSCCDTATARITLNDPRPRFVTSGGSESLQRKAELMEKICDGVRNKYRGLNTMVRGFHDCTKYHVGLVRVDEDGRDVYMKRIHPWQLLVNNAFCVNGEPSEMYLRDWLDVEYVKARWPHVSHDVIDAASIDPVAFDQQGYRRAVKVIEGWSMPIYGKPGRRVMCIDGATLEEEPWTDEGAPFVKFTWNWDEQGYYGTSLIDELIWIQKEISRLVAVIQRNAALFGIPFIAAARDSNIKEWEVLSNKIARLVQYSSVPPQFLTPPIINQQFFYYLESLINRAYELSGVSQFSATSKKPADLESGEAIRAYIAVESTRFSVVQKMYEGAHIQLGRLIIAAARRLRKKKPNWFVPYVHTSGEMEKVFIRDADLDPCDYTIDIYPESAFPRHPAARVDRILQMADKQWIAPQEARALIKDPDLDKFQELDAAPYEAFEGMFEFMLSDNGHYIEPIPYGMDLQLGIALCSKYYAYSLKHGYPEEKQMLLLNWMRDAAQRLAPPEPVVPPEDRVAPQMQVPPEMADQLPEGMPQG